MGRGPPYNQGNSMDAVGPYEFLARAAFYGVAALTLAGGWVAVWARNLFRAALGLAAALFGVAVLYLYLEAEFLAVTQLLIYVGAILVLIIFGVMLTARIADPGLPRWNQQAGVTWAIAGGLGVLFILGFLAGPWGSNIPLGSLPSTAVSTLGRALISVYLLPFELLSVLLLGALVGAIVIARQEK